MSKIKDLLDQRYGLRTPRLHATVTAAPLVAGRSAGYVIATVGGVGGVRVNVSPDMRAPYAVGDTLVVDGVGTPAATEYWASGRIAGARSDSDIYQYPDGGTVTIGGTSTTLGAGDFVLGSTLTDMANWWYQNELGRWQIRKGALMHGAIGDLNSLYGYATSTYGTAFGQYSAGQVNVTTDSTNGFRIRAHTTPVFQADTSGVVWALSTFRAGTGDDMVGMSATDATWRLYAGNATPASAPFRVDKDGALTASGATISGAITSGTIDIGGADATSFHVDVDGNVWSGAAAYANGVFKVSSTGALTATGATITAGAGAVVLDEDGVTLASAVSGGAGSLKTKSSTVLIGEYRGSKDGANDVAGGVDLFNFDATSSVTSSFGVYHSAGLSSRYVSASTPTTSVNTIIGSKLVLNIRAATGTVVSLQDNFTTEYWGLTNAGTMIGPAWKPAANSTTALQMQKANGDAVVTVDTTNSELEVTGGVIVSGGISQKGIYNVLNYGSVGNGSTDDTAAITAAHAAATATGGEIHFPSGTYLITATTFAADTSLRFAAGAMLSIPTGETITINGAISAGDQQIFTGVGSVRINNATELNAMWFGVSAANAAATNDAGFARLLRSFPAANATTFDAYNVPSTATGHVVKLPAGIITISATVNMTNIGTLILQGADAAGNYGNTSLAWGGAAAGTMVLMDGTPGSSLSYIGLLGRGIAGVGLLLDRSNVNYVRSFNTFNNLSIADCSVAGLLISSSDAPNLYQVDNIQFYNVLIQRCYGGVCINNRNTLNVHFFSLRVTHNGAAGGIGSIVPTYALWVKYGGCIVHSFDFGGPPGDDFADYPIQVENGFVQIFGGYTENGQLISGDSVNPSGATDSTGITTTDSYVITNVTDTSDFNVLDRVIVDKGIAGAPSPCEIVSKTSDSLTVNAIGTSDETGVTVTVSHVTDNTTIASCIIGFNHYPGTDPSAPDYCIYWNQGERSLNISGSRIGQYICEGSNSGGINIVDSQIHNVPTWTGCTKYSSVRNTRVLRSYQGTGTDYIINWQGMTGASAADTERDIALSNNFYRRDDYLVARSTGVGSILRQVDGKLILYQQIADYAGQTFSQLDYERPGIYPTFETGDSTVMGKYISLGGKSISWAAAAPTAGAWALGSVIFNSAISAGQSMGWMCTSAGTFSSATDSTGVTAIGSSTITGVTDTSDFNVGDWVTVDKGILYHPGPFEIFAKTASTITLNSAGDSVETGVTIATSDPVFKTMPTVAA